MVNRWSVAVPTHTLLALADYLRASGSPHSPEDIAAIAIEQWIERAAVLSAAGHDPQGRGYQWKSVFLPSGSQLRMMHAERYHYATVEGDALVFRGRATSPARMVNQIAGGTRNAWQTLWLRCPGEQRWTPASMRRRAIADHAGQPPAPSVAQLVAPSVQDMPANLRKVLALLESAQQARQSGYTRRTDMLPEDYPLSPSARVDAAAAGHWCGSAPRS